MRHHGGNPHDRNGDVASPRKGPGTTRLTASTPVRGLADPTSQARHAAGAATLPHLRKVRMSEGAAHRLDGHYPQIDVS